MPIEQREIKKLLNKKLHQLNEIVADISDTLTDLETDFYRVSIFGSARINETSPVYKDCYNLAYALGKEGVDIVTGAGPGIMEAANKGSKAASNDTKSIGLAIQLPFESDANAHLDIKHEHRRFSSRLDEFMRITHSVVVVAGGVGTLLELFYTWQLIQVKHIEPRPFLLYGKDMWQGLMDWIEKEPLGRQLISQSDFDSIRIVDSVEEVLAILKPEIDEFHRRKKP
jgi:uncharacterized protein (TIGR00730 family)